MGKGLLRYSDVRLIVASVGLSALGDFLAFVPLALQLEQTTDSPLAVSAVLIALWGPVVALSPVAGLVVDRFETRRVLVAVSAAQAAVAALLAFQADSTVAILALSALLGIGFAVAQPAEFALVPALVPAERLNEANGLVETARYAGMIVGPLIGSLLAGAGGLQIALLANAATFAAVAVAGLRLRVRRPPRPRTDEGAADRARDGFVHLFEDRVLATVLVVAVVSLVFMTTSWTAEVFFVRDVLGSGDFGYGLLFATWGLGMVLGGLVLSRRIRGATLATAALVAVLVQGAGLGLPTLWLVLPFAIALAFVGGLGHGLKNVLVRTLIQQRVPNRLHGRAAAAYNGLRNGAELIALGSGGLLVAGVGPRATLALAGGIPILAAVAGLAMRRRSLAERRQGRPVPVSGGGTIATASAE